MLWCLIHHHTLSLHLEGLYHHVSNRHLRRHNLQDNKRSLNEYIDYIKNVDSIDINTLPIVKTFRFSSIEFDIQYTNTQDSNIIPPNGFNTY